MLTRLYSFDFVDKTLLVLSATNGGVSIVIFATVFGAPLGIPSTSLVYSFLLITEFQEKTFKSNERKQKEI